MTDRRITIQTITQLVLAVIGTGIVVVLALQHRADRADHDALLAELREARQARYEYKVVNVVADGGDRQGDDALKLATATPSEPELTRLGSAGWELVGTYLELETAYPNFGDSKYVTGLQPNVRPQRAVLILRRRV